MFPKLKHFTKEENWGDPDKMNVDLLKELDAFRDYLDTPFVITYGTQGIHEKNSEHYLGLAVDFIIPGSSIPVLDILIAAFRFRFTGIGYYPEWKLKNTVTGGWHLQLVTTDTGPRKLWMGVRSGTTQKYIALSQENLKKYGKI